MHRTGNRAGTGMPFPSHKETVMSQSQFRKTALAAALLTVGIAFGAQAQTYGAQPSTGSKSSATSPTPVPNSTGQASTAPGTAPMTPGTPSATTTSPGKPAASTADRSAGRNNVPALASSDRKFIEKAAKGGMAEVELAKLAQEKASSDQVKQFAKRMADDHSKANDQLKSLAASKGVTLPTELDRSDRRALDKLAKKSGADFDREYMEHMVSDHKKDVGDFKSEAKGAKDAELKSFAASTLPTLEQHLDLAKSTEAAVKNEAKQARASAASSTRAPSTSNTPPTRGAPATKATGAAS
jgi:putative membrane protein